MLPPGKMVAENSSASQMLLISQMCARGLQTSGAQPYLGPREAKEWCEGQSVAQILPLLLAHGVVARVQSYTLV